MWDVWDSTLKILSTGLDGAELRHKIIANNAANVSTPDFKRQDVNFQSQLKSMMGEGNVQGVGMTRTNEKHLDGRSKTQSTGFQIINTDSRVREDGNNVNIDVEMAKMAENIIYYNTVASAVANKYKLIDSAIKGGER